MATLRDDLEALLELQRLDCDLDQKLKAKNSLDDGSTLTALAQAAQLDFESVKSHQSATSGALKDAELELASIEKKLNDYQNRMRSGSVTSVREVTNIEKEIHQLTRQRSSLDEKVLALMDETEKRRVSVRQSQERKEEAERNAGSQRALYRVELERFESELAELSRQRAEKAPLIQDQKLLKKYDSVRARGSSSGLAIARVVEPNQCGACHTQISTQDARRAHESEILVLCENCGRILC